MRIKSYYEGQVDERAWITEMLDSKHIPSEGDAIHNESGQCVACEAIQIIKDRKYHG